MVQPLVSVIVPSYNYGHFIADTLQCLCAQSYPHWECIIVDDGSTDNTQEVVANFMAQDPRFSFFRQRNRRQAAAKNTALEKSVGEYIQFLDADDLIEKRKLERQVEYLTAHPEVDIVYGEVRFFPTEDVTERLYTMWGENASWQPGISGRGSEILLPLIRLNTIPINSALTRRKLVEKVGCFDEELPPVEDWDFWVRCAAAGALFHYSDMEETWGLIRSHPESSSKNRLRLLSSTRSMRKRWAQWLADAGARRANGELLAVVEGNLGAEQVLQGSWASGVYHLAAAAVFDRPIRHRLKWLSCAVAAPFVGRDTFQKFYSSSITRAVARPLHQLRLGGRH